MVLKVSLHYTHDWCHLCGQLRTALADVFYPDNAEHELLGYPRRGPDRYIRICRTCANRIAFVAGSESVSTSTD